MTPFLLTLHLADNALLMAQRNSEWTGHGPVLEQDIAITNIALDYLGQSRNLYQYAADVYNKAGEEEKSIVDALIPRPWKKFGRELQEDDLAFLRDEHQYLNLLMTELPKGDWAFSILRLFFFSAFQILQYRQIAASGDKQLEAISEKSIKEVMYHLRWSSEWVIRLGDGTEESRSRIKQALKELWPFTGELFMAAGFESGRNTDPTSLKGEWMEKVKFIFNEAQLELPAPGWMQSGGKSGRHTEHLGYLLTEMQYLQRVYPDSIW